MIKQKILDLHTSLLDDYLILRKVMKDKKLEDVKYSYKDYVQTVFQSSDILELSLEDQS